MNEERKGWKRKREKEGNAWCISFGSQQMSRMRHRIHFTLLLFIFWTACILAISSYHSTLSNKKNNGNEIAYFFKIVFCFVFHFMRTDPKQPKNDGIKTKKLIEKWKRKKVSDLCFINFIRSIFSINNNNNNIWSTSFSIFFCIVF